MTTEERRDKRVLAQLKVRYKTATVTEFIEKHSHDISAGGVFIRAKKPMPKGTLLKIDFRLEDDTPVIQGVGRVVWIREVAESADKPPGMGIKYVKLDDVSKENIGRIIEFRAAGKPVTRDSVIPKAAPPESFRDVRAIPLPKPTKPQATVADDDEVSDADIKTAFSAAEDEDDRPTVTPPPPVDEVSGQTRAPEQVSAAAQEEPPAAAREPAPARTESAPDKPAAAEAPPAAAPPPAPATSSAPAKKRGALIAAIAAVVIAGAGLAWYFAAATPPPPPPPAEVPPPPAPEPPPPEEPPPPPPVPMGGPLTIRTSVPGATVTLNGERRTGVTPLEIPSLRAGEPLKVEASLFGHGPASSTVTLSEGQPAEVSLELVPAEVVAEIRSDVTGATITVNGEKAGKTPLTLKKNVAQEFEYILSKKGYLDLSGRVTAADWTFADGRYLATVSAVLTQEPEEPKPVAAPRAERTSRPAATATPTPDATPATAAAPTPTPAPVTAAPTPAATPTPPPAPVEKPKPPAAEPDVEDNPY